MLKHNQQISSLRELKDKEDDNKEEGLTEMEYMNLFMKFIQK